MPEPVFFQAHRGAIDERPENTMVALRHAWQFPGAIPEVDLRTTRDGVMICLHNPTLAATTNAPASIKDTPVSELTYEEISRCDAGITFAPEYAGTQVPRFTDVLALMAEQPGRQLYPDLKEVDLAALKALIDRYDLEARMIFTHGEQSFLQDLIKRFPQGQTMTWCSGSPTRIKARFAALASSNFAGIDYLQFHWPSERSGDQLTYLLEEAFLTEAMAQLTATGTTVQLRLFDFDPPAIRRLLDLGVRWFVTDAPGHFAETVTSAWNLNNE